MQVIRNFGLFIVVAAVFLVSSTVYTVSEKERAILLRLGEIINDKIEPGIHFKLPIYHTVKKLDARIMPLDAQPKRYLTKEKKSVIVDSFVNWRIDKEKVKTFYNATQRGNESEAAKLLMATIDKRLRDEFANRTIQEVVSGEREEIMSLLVESANQEASKLGIEIIDVRVMKIDLPPQVSNSVYRRMTAAREKIARDLRSKGAEEAEKIKANADKTKVITIATAFKKAQETRGQGDAKATEIYANAYGKNSEFYAIYRRLEAYKKSMNNKQDVLILQPDSDFFKYFKGL